ncbi:MAG: hypothetical protein ACKOQ2_13880 [Dolichospermum sp.]
MRLFFHRSYRVFLFFLSFVTSLAGIGSFIIGIGSFIIDCHENPGVSFCKFFIHTDVTEDQEELVQTEPEVFKRPKSSDFFPSSTTHDNNETFLRPKSQQ